MKSLRTNFEDKATLEAFLQAHNRASKGKANRSEVRIFNLYLINNLIYMADVVKAGNYVPSPYRSFTVLDPKKREILSLPYTDRIVHQWVVEEFIKPYFMPRLIGNTFACIPGRGIHRAVEKSRQMMYKINRDNYGKFYILKMDISKFFNNIDQNILYNILDRVIDDPKLMQMMRVLIFDKDRPVGIPIGNYTSQWFANIYLNELDRFVVYELGVKNYVRYMDDFVIYTNCKASAALIYREIEKFLWERLRLKLNPKSCYYPGTNGLDFVGYRQYLGYRLLRRRSKVKLKEIIYDYENGYDSKEEFVLRINAWHGHAKHAFIYNYVNRNLLKYKDILPAVFDNSVKYKHVKDRNRGSTECRQVNPVQRPNQQRGTSG